MKTSNTPVGYRTNIRLSLEMSEWVKAQAFKNFRSFNAEIVEMVRKAMAEDANKEIGIK